METRVFLFVGIGFHWADFSISDKTNDSELGGFSTVTQVLEKSVVNVIFQCCEHHKQNSIYLKLDKDISGT